ncbi:conserved hypothetical protein [Hyella patelloides LEGE 07179]|uniref:Uncharacterized protein n=1 Tax=Hyella patelloides LEGE 07179 TaxID=945734 RepID=A0A563W3N9_9CYAN|nr:hypothetical protein [Hyella patelloides]VEP18309.1 conserved hypothetical protein [Hyella patelloides LEGE 07179]
MSKYIKQVTANQETITIEFNDCRKLTASINFLKFVSDKIATKPWNIFDLITKNDFVIASGGTTDFPSDNKTIWFETKHLKKSCAITTAWYWYKNQDKLGEKISGQKLPNNQKVSDRHIVLE